jgi:hypothetical protein
MPAASGLSFSHGPYTLSGSSYSSGTTTAKISGIHAAGTTAGCVFVIDGTSANADDGSIVITYSNSTGQLKFVAGGNLHFYHVSGCYGVIASGDPLTLQFSAPYKLSPKQTITSP